MRPRKPVHAPGINGAVATVSELKAAGVSHWRFNAGDVPRVFHGLAVAPGTNSESFEIKVEALRRLMVPGRFISRHTAARVYGLPVQRILRELDVGAVRPLRPPRHEGLRGHQVRRGIFRSLPTSPDWIPAPGEVWATLASTESLEQLVVVGDFLISGPNRQAEPICDLLELEDVVKRFKGCVGIARLRDALPLLRTGVESPAESKARLLIVRAGFPEPKTCCPVPVYGRILHADLGYPELKIAIDYEGEYHYSGGVEQGRKDNSRHEAMRDAGWTVLTITAIDLRDPRDFLRRLSRAIRASQAGR